MTQFAHKAASSAGSDSGISLRSRMSRVEVPNVGFGRAGSFAGGFSREFASVRSHSILRRGMKKPETAGTLQSSARASLTITELKLTNHTVDGQNPAAVARVTVPSLMVF